MSLAIGKAPVKTLLRLRVAAAAETAIRSGPPWVFAGSIHEQKTGFRWINGESDGWPGLVLDRYDTTLVLKLYTAAWLARLKQVVELIDSVLPAATLPVLRSSSATESGRSTAAEVGSCRQERPASARAPAR